jgi:crotonyl-CoA carboxylase/reductase
MRELYELNETPPLGTLPRRMWAQVIRPERYGQPKQALAPEAVPVPTELGPRDVLVWVKAAGINYNNVWAATGSPVDVLARRRQDPYFPDQAPFHIGGSDGAGIVWKVGRDVTQVRVGDEVVLHCGVYADEHREELTGEDPVFAPSFRTWGYETNYGAFAQFARVRETQCVPRPQQLGWVESAAYMLVGATAYRMLHGHAPHAVRRGDVVLVWGGAGGLGSMAIQLAREAGAFPIAVISGDEKREHCTRLGAVGCIDRRRFDHWGVPPRVSDPRYGAWLEQARAFGAAIWDVLGERKSPRIVVEHPGESTFATSAFCCASGGMVVTCAGTTGYTAAFDLRHVWMRGKRLQGSHFANDAECAALNRLVAEGRVEPCLGARYTFAELPEAHQAMFDNRHPAGNMACTVSG